jgi:diguanylate cyclase (GGDEF)-like protein
MKMWGVIVTKKTGKKVKIFVVVVISLLFILLHKSAYAKNPNEIKNILILNSYHQGLDWTKEEANGIVDTLKNSNHNIATFIEYMDWKNYPTELNLNYLYDYYKYKYEHKQIDMIITTDDAALKFALAHRRELFSDATIVFCGVNQEGAQTITKGYTRVTGAIELIDPTKTIQIALNITESLKNIYLIYDNTESGLSTGKIITDKINLAFPELNIIPCNNLAYGHLIKEVQELGQESIVLVTTYYRDVNNRFIDMEYANRDVSSNSAVPVYQLYDFSIGSGVLGGSMISGRLQGESAADLAIRILNGENIEDIPISTPESYRTIFDYKQLERYHISMKEIPKDSEIMNKPFSFYETYKTLVISVVISFAILICFVGILLFYIRMINRMKKNLTENHEELTQLYEELTASDEEMRQQYDQIVMNNEKIRIGEEKLTFLAYHDSLTGLPNKLSLYENAKKRFHRNRNTSALFFIDIDNFKNVNDTMGHTFGDQLIVKVSDRFCTILDQKKTIYRLSGDEFIMIVEEMNEISEVEQFASHILNVFRDEFEIQEYILHISLSIGISLFPQHGSSLDELLKYADIAMYQAKEAGRKSFMIYDQRMNEVFTERMNIEKQLENALEHEEFILFYQPQLDIKTNKVTGFEALLRWRNPVLGNVSPVRFIHIAEDTHMIIPIGTWVLKSACDFLHRLNRLGFQDLTVSVNISILQLLQSDFCDIVNQTIKYYEIQPQNLELEITESILMESFERIGSKLEELCAKNIKIALDDFGKGYSSLNYLKQLPITTLKVDKSFIDHIVDKKGDTLTGHIVSIGKSMGMCVIAEGVEHQEQLEYLAEHDCDKIQGYLYSKPVPEEELIKLLQWDRYEI